MEGQAISGSKVLRLTGGVIALFSLVVGLLVLFVIPMACSFIGSLGLIALFILFVLGGLTFVIGEIMSRKKGRITADSVGVLE